MSDLQEYLDQLETVESELLEDPDNAELSALKDELLELIELLQDTNAGENEEDQAADEPHDGDYDTVNNFRHSAEPEPESDLSLERPAAPKTAPKAAARPPLPAPLAARPPPPGPPASASPTSPPPPPGSRPALSSQNALAPKKKKSKWEKQEEALDDTKNKWQKFSSKANSGRQSMFQSPQDSSSKGEY